jgi:hypothetical protein
MQRNQGLNVGIIIKRLHHAARVAKLDCEANQFAQLADRVAEQGTPFVNPLTAGEQRLLTTFLGIKRRASD